MDLEKTYTDGSVDCYGNTLMMSEVFGWYQNYMKTSLIVYKLDNNIDFKIVNNILPECHLADTCHVKRQWNTQCLECTGQA